jgi:ATP-dependent helicase/nuclease subunit B
LVVVFVAADYILTMPNHTLHQSSSADHRVAPVTTWLKSKDTSRGTLVIGASRTSADELVRAVAISGTAVFGWYRLTLLQVARSIAAWASVDPVPNVGHLGQKAILARAVDALRDEAGLGRFDKVADAPGFVQAARDAIEEIGLQAVADDQLQDVTPDFGRVLSAYRAQLRESGMIDRVDVYQTATEALANDVFTHPFMSLPTVLLDVPVRTRAEIELIQALAGKSSGVVATVQEGDERSAAGLVEALGCDVTIDKGDADSPLSRMRRRLFDTTAIVEEEADNEALKVFSEAGEHLECVEIARRIHRLADDGVPFDKIGILLHSPELYRPHLEDALDRAGIPAYFSRGVTRPDPSGRAFISLLLCAAEGLSARRFAEYLSLGQVPDATAEGEPPTETEEGDRWVSPDDDLLADQETEPTAQIDLFAPTPVVEPPAPVVSGTLRAPRRWERLLVEASVIGGLDRWRRRLAGLEQELALKLDDRDDLDEATEERLNRELDHLKSLRGYALPILMDLDRLRKPEQWGVWIQRLTALATRCLREPGRVLSVLSELAPMASVGPVGIDEVYRVLAPNLLELTERPESDRYGRVFVAPIEAARGLAFDAVFIPGLAERLFPSKIVQDPILGDRVRKRLDSALATNEDRVQEERLSLRIAMGAAREQVFLSYPRVDLEHGRQRVSSFYALESLRAMTGTLPSISELDREAQKDRSTRPGWPAPKEANDAIDHAEFDLSIIDALLDADKDQAAGSARYLIESNDHLARSLRWRYRRYSNAWTIADGLMIRKEAERDAIEMHRLKSRAYSPTALQAYAACPYQFFLKAIQRLSPREEAEAIERMDPLQRGALIHDIQYAALSLLRDRRVLPVTELNLGLAYSVLEEAVNTVAENFRDRLAPAIDRVWHDAVAAIHADLREWLYRMSEDETGFVPWRFELSFGLRDMEKADPHSTEDPIEVKSGFRLRGCIDVLERNAKGELRVVDHKTGRVRIPDGAIIGGGESLQPLLYGLVTKVLFEEAPAVFGELYYCTTAGGFEKRGFALKDNALLIADRLAETIDASIERGQLPAAPKEEACKWCDFKSICGHHEEQRTERKPDIPQLTWLRSLT